MRTIQELDAPVRTLLIDLQCTQIECHLGANTKVTHHGRPLEVHLSTTGTSVTITHEPGIALDIVDGVLIIGQLIPEPKLPSFDAIASMIATSGLSRYIADLRGKPNTFNLRDLMKDKPFGEDPGDLGAFGGLFGERRI